MNNQTPKEREKHQGRCGVEVTVTVPRHQGIMEGGDIVALALGVAMEVVVEISPPVFWFGTFAMTAGLPEDLRGPFGQFGRLKDVYLPRDYYTGQPRGFGFVQYLDPADAADAKYHMDGYVLLGRELTVVFAEENRKKPSEMRARERSALHQVILDHQDMLEVTPAVHTIILLLLGKDVTQGLFLLEIRDIENGLTRAHPMAQGVLAGALVGAGAKVWTILGD
ncbi:hypothetical protein GOBAR_DD07074 [Gossypium barbadense]|nr:hypothetical protein GOBAR_DD07074 [Gossypium barbadense]